MLLPGDAFDKCPSGLEIASEECLDAAKSMTEHIDTIDGTNLLVDDWIGLPCGCFVYNNKRINYDSNCDNRGLDSTSNLVCKQVCILEKESFYVQIMYNYCLLRPLSLLNFVGH